MKQQLQNKQIEWKKIEKKEDCFNFYFKDKPAERIRIIRKPKKTFVANGGLFGIKVDNLFFSELNDKEKVALLWHEYYHRINNWKRIPILELKSIFGLRFNYFHIVEFEADEFSALHNSIDGCLSLLKTAKRLYSEKKVGYNPKTHPKIEERIKRIEILKNETTNTNQ